jgi:hypothetical protein
MGKASRRKQFRKNAASGGYSQATLSAAEQRRLKKKQHRSLASYRQSFFHRLTRIWKFLAGVIVAISTYVGIVGFAMPRITVEPMSALDATDPYTYTFKVQNQGYTDLLNVFYSCKVKGAWIDGRTYPITIIQDENEWLEMAPAVKGEIFRTLAPNETDSCSCQLFNKPVPFMLEDKRLFAVVVNYRPAYFPFSLEKQFTFSLKKASDGTYQWLPVANQRE